jgi:SH3-like domain-containing protein
VIREVPAIEDEVKDYRIVGKCAVAARRSCKPRAPIKEEIEPGRIVRLIEKQSQWCRVEWYDWNGLAEQGWVKSKYLKRLD